MEITAREAFKLGFLMKCAADGLTPSQIDSRARYIAKLIKLAADAGDGIAMHELLSAAEEKLRGSKGMSNFGLAALGTAGVGIPLVGGWMLGSGLRKLQGDLLTKEDVRKQELINEMNALTERSRTSQSKALGL